MCVAGGGGGVSGGGGGGLFVISVTTRNKGDRTEPIVVSVTWS